MNGELMAAIEERSTPYQIDFARHVITVPGFFQWSSDEGGLRALTAEFSPDVLRESGVFDTDSLQPLIRPGGLFLVLRNAAGQFIDLAFEEESARDAFLPLQVLRDATFLNCRRALGRACFVDSLADLAILWACGIRGLPGWPLWSASKAEINTTLERLAALPDSSTTTSLVVTFADWSIDRVSYEVSPRWRTARSICNRIQAVARKPPSIWLWRPSRERFATVQVSRQHNPDWFQETLGQSVVSDIRHLSEADRPLDEGQEMVFYKLRRLFNTAVQYDTESGGGLQYLSQHEFMQAVMRSFQSEALPLAGDDSSQAARLLEAKLQQYAALSKMPAFIFNAVKVFRGNPQQSSITETSAFRELLDQVRASAKVARDLLKK